MMRILLVNPPGKFIREARCQHKASVFQSLYPPLTLATMAALLLKEAEVMIVDSPALTLTLRELQERVIKFKPYILIFQTSTPTIETDLKIIEECKRVHKAIYGIFSVHATYFSDELIRLPFIDFVILGEPEFTALSIVKNGFKATPGVIWKEDEKIRKNEVKPSLALSLPIPAWNLVNLNSYLLPIKQEPYLMVITGRGCPYSCSFCVSPFYFDKKFRKRAVNEIIEELKYDISLGIRNFFFFTDTFTLDKKMVMELTEKIRKLETKIKWFCNSRVDTIDKEMLKEMKDSGCFLISFGVESGDEEILKRCKKGTDLEVIRKALYLTKSSGILSVCHFILGLPGETEQTLNKTIRLALELPTDFAEFYISTPFPGSAFYEEVSQLIEKRWDRFEYSSQALPTSINLKAKRKEAITRFYLRPKFILTALRAFGIKNLYRIARTGIDFLKN